MTKLRIRVLVVDDEPGIRASLRGVPNDDGFEAAAVARHAHIRVEDNRPAGTRFVVEIPGRQRHDEAEDSRSGSG